jgi:hypothetical protein
LVVAIAVIASQTAFAQLPTLQPLVSFHPPSEARGDSFGADLDVFGNNVFIAARFADIPVSNAGRVYQYELPGGNYIRTLENPSPTADDQFGTRVESNEEFVAVSALFDDSHGSDAGIVYVFSVATGQLLKTIASPHPTTGGMFGSQMRMVGNSLYISSRQDQTGHDSPAKAGAVYEFSLPEGDILRTFDNPEPDDGDMFGFLFDLNEDYLLVGACEDDTLGTDTGSAYLFDLESGALVHTFRNPTPGPSNDRFGCGVALAGGKAVVGALNDNTHGAESGACYVFDLASGTLERTIHSPEARQGGQFGGPLIAMGSLVVVGEPFSGNVGGSSGRAYLIDPLSGNILTKLQSPNPVLHDHFGNPFAVAGDLLLVGAWGREGAAYLYDTDGSMGPTSPLVEIHPESPTSSDDLVCEATGSVDSLGLEVSYAYQWLIDGLEVTFDGFHSVTGPSLSQAYTSRGQTVECVVTPSSPSGVGIPGSDSVVIGNSPPTQPVVRILPENPTPDDPLAVWIEVPSIDPDGDLVLYIFEWYSSFDGVAWTRRPELSGSLSPFTAGEPEISSLYTRQAPFWAVTVTPIEAHTIGGKSAKGIEIAGVPVVGTPGVFQVQVLPDFDGDDLVEVSDVLQLRGMWHWSKREVPLDRRGILFAPEAAEDAEIGASQLFRMMALWQVQGGATK